MSEFQAYLEAKRPVDDRALNDRVFRAFANRLAALAAAREGPVRIVEVGSGIGSMVVRLAERDALPDDVRYRLIDRDAAVVDRAREWLPVRLAESGYTIDRTQSGFTARAAGRGRRPASPADGAGTNAELDVSYETGDAFADVSRPQADAVIGSAVFDLVNLDRALEWLSEVLGADGVLYAPLTFDGATGFAPSALLDDRIERLYHRHMDEVRDEPGGSRAGRQLVGTLDGDRAFEVLDVGGSDWVLRPQDRSTDVAERERTVLRYLLETIDGALADYPASTLDPDARGRWVRRRRDELDTGELTFLAHHLDVLARRSD